MYTLYWVVETGHIWIVQFSWFLFAGVKGAAPPPTHIFGGVAKDHIYETTEAMSMKQAPVWRPWGV